MNLLQLQADLNDTLGYGTGGVSSDALVTRRLLRYMNNTQRELATMRGLARLRRSVLTFASVASSPFAVLPQAAVRIAGIQDRSSQKALEEIQIQDLRFMDPGLTTLDSNPSFYVIISFVSPVARQPSAAAALFIKSTDAADIGTAYIQGITTGGYPRIASVTMTGLTAVDFGPTDWIEVTKLYISASAAGVVTLHQTSGAGTELARISVARTFARYTRIQLYGTPSQALTYYADVDLHIEDLANANDEPYLPEDFHWLIGAGARMKEYVKRKDFPSYGVEKAMWKDGVAQLQAFCRQVSDTGHSFGSQPPDFTSSGGLIWARKV